MSHKLSEGAIEAIVSGNPCENPLFQIVSFKRITSGSGSDRYRLLVSDGKHSYSHFMLATQLNQMMESGEMDNMCVVKVGQYICNTLQGGSRVIILLEVEVVAKGADVDGKIGNPQAFKPGTQQQSNSTSSEQAINKPAPGGLANGHKSPPSNKAAFNIKPRTPGTPGSNRIHSIASLTPYQNRWRIRARVTQKSNIRTWSNSRGEGRLFSVNLIDESGEIRATGFTDVVDKYYEMLEVNKSQIESSVAAQGSIASSESGMEEYVYDLPATILSSQPEVPVAATDQTATFPVPTTSKGGKGKSTKKPAPRHAPGTDDVGEAAAITNQLQRQQVEAGKIQGQTTQLLEKDGASAMAHFGSFLGKLGSQIDGRLVDGFYKEALDLTLRTIAKSHSLPPLQPPAAQPPAQHAQYDSRCSM